MSDAADIQPRDVYLATYSDAHGWGGALSLAVGLGEALDQRGHSSLILGTASGDTAPPDASAARLNVPLLLPAGMWRVRSWCAAKALAHELRRLPPPRMSFVATSPFWLVAAKRAWPNVPAIYAFPCLLANCLPFTWPQRRPPTLWQRADFTGIRRIEQLAFARADLTLAPTRQARTEIGEFAPRSASKVEQCHYGLRHIAGAPGLREQQRRALGAADDAFLIATVGTCDRNKAFDLAVDVLPSLDPRARLIIIGDGPERDRLEQTARALGVGQRVHCVGPQQEMARWYAAADCVISTSYYDTYPNVIREALQCGKPVVLPHHDPPHVYSGLAEVIEQHGGGRLYDRRRLDSLAETLADLMHAPTTSASLGRAARCVAAEHFQWNGFADLILAQSRPRATCEAACVS